MKRSELSKRSKWWIPKERYLELKHFCMQYKDWKRACYDLDESGVKSRYILQPASVPYSPITGSSVEKIAMSKTYYSWKIGLVEEAASYTDDELYWWILRGVTTDEGYTALKMMHKIPCGKDMYYDRYRKFFWILDKLEAERSANGTSRVMA